MSANGLYIHEEKELASFPWAAESQILQWAKPKVFTLTYSRLLLKAQVLQFYLPVK